MYWVILFDWPSTLLQNESKILWRPSTLVDNMSTEIFTAALLTAPIKMA